MGDEGLSTRILGPSRGSFLTYAPIDAERATAPGQVTAERLKNVYRIQDIKRSSLIHGLVGSPVMHSISPHIHNAAFNAENIDAFYLPFEVKDLDSFMRRMVNPASREIDWRLNGLSITAPHKVEIMKYLTSIDARATDIGAVNTVTFEGEDLVGYNTDVDGFIEPLAGALPLTSNVRVAVIGAGGAAKAAIWSLREKGADVTLFARDRQKGKSLAARFDVRCELLEAANFKGFDVVVNATPLGSFGSRIDETPATAEQLRGVQLAYDLVYNPSETRFMREAKLSGCRTLGGLEMLLAQAKVQFKLWTGREAPAEAMHSAALRGLTNV
jgi:3-dehydroquinate dehydratase/shikimate dehydrogenase